MKKNEWFIILLIAGILYYHFQQKKECVDNICPIVKPTVVTPVEPIKPVDTPIPIVEQKPCLMIFTAKWCGFCRSLKKDLPNLDINKYELCFVDVDDKTKKDLIKKFDIQIIPTSIVLEHKTDKEIKRITGYDSIKYKTWLGQ